MSKHIMDNYVVSDWYRLTNSAMFNQVPFGVYALTEPTDSIPSSDILPHEYDKTITLMTERESLRYLQAMLKIFLKKSIFIGIVCLEDD